jgi:hypothetical protein
MLAVQIIEQLVVEICGCIPDRRVLIDEISDPSSDNRTDADCNYDSAECDSPSGGYRTTATGASCSCTDRSCTTCSRTTSSSSTRRYRNNSSCTTCRYRTASCTTCRYASHRPGNSWHMPDHIDLICWIVRNVCVEVYSASFVHWIARDPSA